MLLKRLITALSLTATVTGAPSIDGQKHSHPRPRPIKEETGYEYVIVGSGPGGGPLAARLALAGHSVLLIEAGGDPQGTNQTIPALNLQSGEDDTIRWDFYVTHYKDLERQKKDIKMTYKLSDGSFYHGLFPPEGAEPLGILYPRASALGGCAEHNAVVTTYPHKSDWSYIQHLTGDDSWAPEKMREYFVKLENNQYTVGAGHGHHGWFSTSLTELLLVAADFKLVSIVLSAAAALGKKNLVNALLTPLLALTNVLLDDYNADTPDRDQKEDFWQMPQAIDKRTSTRSTPRNFIMDTANAVNEDGSRRYKLDIKLNTLATKIRFDMSDSKKPRAIGVEYLEGKHLYAASANPTSGGTPGYVAASKEVVVAGGTFNTPHLLKLSGVGPREELEKFNIPCVKDLPGVGTNMQDRYEISIVAQAKTKLAISKDCSFNYPGKKDKCLERYKKGSTPLMRGPYSTGGVAIGVTKKSSAASASEDADLIIIGAPGQFAGYFPGFAYNAIAPGNIWSWLALKAHTHNNAGTVTLRSNDPHDVPQIDFNSFDTGNTDDNGHEKDLQALEEGLAFGRKAFDKLIPLDGTFTEIQPGRNVTDLKGWARENAWGHHACCSAAIGADNDPMAVLDSEFRVRGIAGLRVVDASAFPKIPGTFIALPIYMISEKAADVIINGARGGHRP